MIKFSGIVVTYNEASRLRDCLESLSFCDEILVGDLGSTDSSVAIAKECGARVIKLPRAPIVEIARAPLVAEARHDWLVLLDPDEALPRDVGPVFQELLARRPDVAEVQLPWQFYFRGKPLNHTVWSDCFKGVLVHRQRVIFSPAVHSQRKLLPGFICCTLPRSSPDFAITHHWMESYRQFLTKHWRYLQQEGEGHYLRNERFSWGQTARATRDALWLSLVARRGYAGGLEGILLSLFYAAYVGGGWLSLRSYEQKRSSQRG